MSQEPSCDTESAESTCTYEGVVVSIGNNDHCRSVIIASRTYGKSALLREALAHQLQVGGYEIRLGSMGPAPTPDAIPTQVRIVRGPKVDPRHWVAMKNQRKKGRR